MAEQKDDRKTDKGQAGVQSVEVAMRILSVIADASHALMLREIVKASGTPAAKVHRYLVSLVRAGMVEQESAGGRYGLGSLALRVGLSALHQLDVVRTASEAITELRDRTDTTAILSVYGAAGPTIIRWEECSQALTMNVRVGSALSLLDSATGRVFAAFLPRSVTDERFSAEMKGRDSKAVDEMLTEIRQRRMALVHGSELVSVNAIAVPVFDQAGKVVAVMALLGLARRFSVSWDSPPAVELRNSGQRVSERLGYRDTRAARSADHEREPGAVALRPAGSTKRRSIARHSVSGAST
ncbi:MAG: IclR family transcriptional regulator [Burkholderiaceae bacterium]|nr:IclR family transcriptional regulator [Burkholderiaceae bacterium]